MLLQRVFPICLAGIVAAVGNDDIATTSSNTCNKADVALVKFNAQSQPGLCNTWLNGQRHVSPVQGMSSDELTAACNCISLASQEMKLALQLPVVRIVKSTKPAPKTTAKSVVKTSPKTTLKTTTRTTVQLVKSSAKSSVKTTTSSPIKRSSSKSATTKVTSVSSSSSRRCIGVACSKLTARTTTSASTKSAVSVKSSVKSPSRSASKSGGKASSSSTTSRGGKVTSVLKSGKSASPSVTGTVGKGISSRKSSSTRVIPTSAPGSDDGSDGNDGGSSSDNGDAGSPSTTFTSDDGSATTTTEDNDGSAAPTSTTNESSAETTQTSDGDFATTSTQGDDGSPASSTSTIAAPTLTSTKPRSVVLPTTTRPNRKTSSTLIKSPGTVDPSSTVSDISLSSSSESGSSSTDVSTSSALPVAKPSPVCTSPIANNEIFQLYISGTNTAIDGTPMQGLTNGATAVGFSVGYTNLNFTLDCSTGYVYWGLNSVLSGNTQAFSVKSQSVVVAPIGDSNNSPLSCSLDTNFALTCQYTSSRSPDVFQGWSVSSGDSRYLAMSQSNTTSVILKAVPLKSNAAITYPTHTVNQNLLINGAFAANTVDPWSKFAQGKSSDVVFNSSAVNASQSCYAFAGMLSVSPNANFVNGYAWTGISQPGVTLYMGEQLFVGYDVLLNYPTGLPSGVRCDIQVKGTEHDTLSYVRYDSNSPAFVSFNTTTTASYNGTGSYSITAYCQGQPGGGWQPLSLGFNNVRLLAAYDSTNVGAALSCGFKEARDTIQSASLQPYCSSLLAYSTPTTTLTEVISTTTTSTMTVAFGQRKRSVITPAPLAVPEPLKPRQLDVSGNSSTASSSTVDGAGALATFAPADVTNACSVEAQPVTSTVTQTTSTTTTITAYATYTSLPSLFLLASSGNNALYISREDSGAVKFTTDPNAALPFYIDDAGAPRSWRDPSQTLVDHYEPNSGAADNRIYIEAPSSASYPVTCRNQGRNAGTYLYNCQSSGPPNGNPVVYGFGFCDNTRALYMIPNSSNVRCGGGYAFAALKLVAYTGN
ncbi:hypothetical protein AUEXF2481DRAFT_32147 [Aureobasidium subglaciale EXF-2481]|uniref:Ig-like domain-containing protein n=1 Tax=Aureobasidium subglaciale (strain EXF-2481) TaxID=1043005 RepID=A0A074Z0F4_AURSE|nr:uncharacterized protein AUEXF2481DRAFT_32147 [Aureobasidium subglaciale EXF-2481]KAI5197094.1 hypothetical protein E4T38_08182 [Aureobasidium subglaciale]KAI5215781.1 hypothetical protein E4T40_08192 [Aureobasidium subglaciale]KAI5219014.1 hypothetical protein E4T41_08107 [Aureobasidium subglaciale]KAI5256611.1 hypothetical protein E4T46_08083 [Aureobasidium subglaciale]KEQ92566.1 hypothetical protein AUEXF2481DRAFT_32147 [Aureobasidium subglaciale EXF-2481]